LRFATLTFFFLLFKKRVLLHVCAPYHALISGDPALRSRKPVSPPFTSIEVVHLSDSAEERDEARRIVEAYGIPFVGIPIYETDDSISVDTSSSGKAVAICARLAQRPTSDGKDT
jgi:hypothetical protein